MSYTISDFRRDYRAGPYAWPGGYPRFFVCADGEPLSWAGAKENRRLILEAILDPSYRTGWEIVGVDINWEDDLLFCVHTGERIASAYSAGPPEDKPVEGIDT